MPETLGWTIRSMLEWCEGYLGRHGDESPRRSAEVLVGKACGLERIGLYLDMDRPLAAAELDILRDDVRKRGQGMPLQYLTGTAPFRYLELEVRPGVLIPRPETEVLVSEALALLPPAPKPQDEYDKTLVAALLAERGEEASLVEHAEADVPIEYLVADVCTGSGCIACSLATEHPQVRVIATDISRDALGLAKDNAEACGAAERIAFVQGNLGDEVDPDYLGAFDLVVSNPPYIPSAVLASIPREVADFEPALALDGGEDGLVLFRELLPWAYRALRPGGSFLCELHEECLGAAADLAQTCGFDRTRIVKDLAGRDRILVAHKPKGEYDAAR